MGLSNNILFFIYASFPKGCEGEGLLGGSVLLIRDLEWQEPHLLTSSCDLVMRLCGLPVRGRGRRLVPWDKSASTQFHTFPWLKQGTGTPLTSGVPVATRKIILEILIICAKAEKEGGHLISYLRDKVESLIFNLTLLCFWSSRSIELLLKHRPKASHC